ncbi:hypothetical protein QTP86_017726 [Hemibagrus guttatus]|nr:hypothetical protein QTP86_017726 [Hemibagrus guttatus]
MPMKETKGSGLDNQTSKSRGLRILENCVLKESGRESVRGIQLGALARQYHESLSPMLFSDDIARCYFIGVMAWPDTYNDELLEINYNMSDKKNWMKMSKILKEFLEPYNDTKQTHCNYYNCTTGKYFIQHAFNAPKHTKWSCPFYQSALGNCSGISDSTFGYNTAQPCVIIKMNRVSTDKPNEKRVCLQEGQDNVRGYEYYPVNGTFDLSYFPYYGKLAQVQHLQHAFCSITEISLRFAQQTVKGC